MMSAGGLMPVQLSILVGNNAALLALGYTRLEIWVSKDRGNTYQEITSAAQTAASLASAVPNTLFRMGGHLLKFRVNGGVEQSVSFGSPSILDYWTPAQVASQINAVVANLAAVVGQQVVLTSPTTGRASQLEITYSDADDLGLVVGTLVNGTDARVTLAGGTLLYQFTDIVGSPDYFYEWRFSANGSLPISNFSDPVSGQTPPLIASGSLSVLTAQFVDIEGRPKKTKIIVSMEGPGPASLAGYAVGGTETKVYESDEFGFLAVPFVRGAQLRVAIEGTPLIRSFTVPNASTFDLLTTLAAATDPFTPQVVPPLLTRMGP
jgi:hypothetical protein